MEKATYLTRLASYQHLSVGLKAYLGFTLQQTAFKRQQQLSLSNITLGGYSYLATGSARIFLYVEDSKQEVTVLFLPCGQMLPDLQPVAQHFNGKLFLEFLEGSTLLSIPEKHMANIHKLFPESVPLNGAINAETLAGTISLLSSLKLLSANERLEKLLDSFPGVFALAAVKDIASYLGIHPSTLSAMRNKK
ncbi:hypothetical protein GCM10022289_45010 [Pedobacter jeongneungensis]|uniref:CRP-like cAMP-binding protein n=1 Tax=Pedobacter jeongneungensis TaxID=947309 RepID=A0ABP8BQ05_9SPHI